MLTEKLFDTGEVVLNVAESSTSGPPLVMLHGATLNWQTFGGITPTLAQRWHIYACDLRGHGGSGWAASGYRIVDCVPDVTRFIERFVGQPAVILGFSFGGAVAIQVAARLPALTRAVIALDPGLMLWDHGIRSFANIYASVTRDQDILASSHTPEDRLAHIRRHLPEIDEAGAEFFLNRIRHLDPAVLNCLLADQTLGDFDLEPVLRQVACPALLVYGEPGCGGLVRESDAALFKANVQHSRLAQIKGAGHGVFLEPFTGLALEQITGFLESL